MSEAFVGRLRSNRFQRFLVPGRGVRVPHAGALTWLFYGSFFVRGLASDEPSVRWTSEVAGFWKSGAM